MWEICVSQQVRMLDADSSILKVCAVRLPPFTALILPMAMVLKNGQQTYILQLYNLFFVVKNLFR